MFAVGHTVRERLSVMYCGYCVLILISDMSEGRTTDWNIIEKARIRAHALPYNTPASDLHP